MKQVLIIDGTLMFSDFVRDKLQAEQIMIDTAVGSRDAYTKIVTNLPDLIIIEINEADDDISDEIQNLLEKKRNDVNAKRIPILMVGPEFNHLKIASLAEFGVIKYFKKPIRFDVFFDSIGKILKCNISMDDTPSFLDIHVNKNIIFIEISKGLNREKIYILKYKVSEIISKRKLEQPKIILMMSDLNLTFVDAINVELLFNSLLTDERIQRRNIKVLSMNKFLEQLIEGHPTYRGIKVANNLNLVLNECIDTDPRQNINDFVTENFLNKDNQADDSSIEIRFSTASNNKSKSGFMNVAIVDDDEMTRSLLSTAFKVINAEVVTYSSGTEFIKAIIAGKEYDMVILDIYIPDMDGFSILKNLQRHNYTKPIIVYSQATQKDAIIQSISLGAKSYLVKPLKPTVIVSKALEVLRNSN